MVLEFKGFSVCELGLEVSHFLELMGNSKDSLENRLRKNGYIAGNDIPNVKRNHKPIRMTLYTITPKGRKLLKGWIGFLSTYSQAKAPIL